MKKAKNKENIIRWQPVARYTKALGNALNTYDDESFNLLCNMAMNSHLAVRIPKRKTLVALIRANPREEFLRRLAASNN